MYVNEGTRPELSNEETIISRVVEIFIDFGVVCMTGIVMFNGGSPEFWSSTVVHRDVTPLCGSDKTDS